MVGRVLSFVFGESETVDLFKFVLFIYIYILYIYMSAIGAFVKRFLYRHRHVSDLHCLVVIYFLCNGGSLTKQAEKQCLGRALTWRDS